jgi:hypothetical protein
MSDKVELIAAAQVNTFAGPPAGIQLKSNYGFKSSARNSDGSYVLTLDDKHDAHKLVINVTPNNTLEADAVASPIGTGDTNQIQVSTFVGGDPTDSPFFITVYRVRS